MSEMNIGYQRFITIDPTRICTQCGEEVDCGIYHTMKHLEDCERNAPNESIQSHIYDLEQAKREANAKIEQNLFDSNVFIKMTKDEQEELFLLSMRGMITKQGDEWVILMGSSAIKELTDFKEAMKTKYTKLRRIPDR